MQGKIFLRKTSLVDYAGYVSSVIFFPGCNLRCPWCHNRDLVLGKNSETYITVDEGLVHINKRHSVLGGVVLSGGEPCLWEGLPFLIKKIKDLSLKVKLDTNGMLPDMLERLFSREETRPDYIALDLKLAPERYAELLPEHSRLNAAIASFDPGEALTQSAALISRSGISHEYRTLALPAVHKQGKYISESDIEALAALTDDAPWYFRPFRSGTCLNPVWDSLEETAGEAHRRAEILANRAKELGKTGLCR